MNVVYTETKDGLTINIIQDEDCQNPFEECDGLPDIIGWHRHYNFNTRKQDKFTTVEEFLAEAESKGYVTLPLFMYEHSGIAFKTSSFSDSWDSGQYGFIFCTKEKREALGFTDKYIANRLKAGETVESWLQEELRHACETLNDYVQGNCYGYQVLNYAGDDVASCWGYLGDYENSGCLADARIEAEHWSPIEAMKRAQDDAYDLSTIAANLDLVA